MPTLILSQLPNLLTVSRILAAPILILLLKDEQYVAGLIVFAFAGASDALDGWIAKRYHLESRLGSILDPIADKLLLVSAYVMLALVEQLPFWLVVCVVFRDLLIVGGYLIYTSMVGPVQMQPSYLSKVNTLMQIALIVVILAKQAAGMSIPLLVQTLVYTVLFTTVASGVHYWWIWLVRKQVELSGRGQPPHD